MTPTPRLRWLVTIIDGGRAGGEGMSEFEKRVLHFMNIVMFFVSLDGVAFLIYVMRHM